MIAVTLVAIILLGIFLPCMFDLRAGTVARARTEMQLRTVASAIDKFQGQHGYLPRTLDEAASVLNRKPKDAWETPIVYRMSESGSPVYYSAGPNRRDDGGKHDDIFSIEKHRNASPRR
ncbi:MAG: hypothetical protein H7Y89_06560 [Steroidobacteraceae bacterium]|nr:hypothetical protein [Steroidobacteraceae bacterium]